MQWELPKGYSFWRYKSRGYYPKKSWLIFSVVAVLICIGAIFNIKLKADTKDVLIFIVYLMVIFLGLPLTEWFRSMYFPGKVTINSTSVCCGHSRKADFYLNEIEGISFEQVQSGSLNFYNCLVKLKPMRASHKDFYQFGMDVNFYKVNKEEIIHHLKFKASAQKYMSAAASD